MATKNQTKPPPRPDNLQSRVLAQSQQWSGPLPPPAALQQFNDIIPNGAERIMSMVEQEQMHRMAYESARLQGEISGSRRGHVIGGAITIIAILVAAGAGYIGVNPIICVAIVGLPIASILKSIFGK